MDQEVMKKYIYFLHILVTTKIRIFRKNQNKPTLAFFSLGITDTIPGSPVMSFWNTCRGYGPVSQQSGSKTHQVKPFNS